MILQEDACLVASFIQMNVFCVQNLQTRPQKTALNIKNTWMPRKLISDVASCRRPAEEWLWCLDPRLSVPSNIASCKKYIYDLSCKRGNLSFWSAGLDFRFYLMLCTFVNFILWRTDILQQSFQLRVCNWAVNVSGTSRHTCIYHFDNVQSILNLL